jgi:hypothetical protein
MYNLSSRALGQKQLLDQQRQWREQQIRRKKQSGESQTPNLPKVASVSSVQNKVLVPVKQQVTEKSERIEKVVVQRDETLMATVEQLQQEIKNMKIKLQAHDLLCNRVEETQYKMGIQAKEFQKVFDQSQIKMKTLEDGLRETNSNSHATFYAVCTRDIKLYESPGSTETNEIVLMDERVQLVYPTVVDDKGFVWIGIRRVFDNGDVLDKYAVFFDKDKAELTFKDFRL